MSQSVPLAVLLSLLLTLAISSPSSDLTAALQSLKIQRELKGMQVQVSQQSVIIFNANLGQKNEAQQTIDNSTMFRVASLSKSFASVAIMQLVEQGKLSLNHSLSSILGYDVENPYYPGVDITVEMALSHQSSLIECDPYYSDFLTATYNAKNGLEVPSLKEILVRGGKYYNDCLFSKTHGPGTYFHYVNLNFGVAGTIVQRISNKRFDQYQQDNILTPLSEGLSERATFNPATIQNTKNLGVIYIGSQGKWTPNYDYYPEGTIPQRNLTGYQIGSNGVIYGPQGALRASASHLSKYAIMLANGGKTKEGKTILKAQSVQQMLRWRYQYNGLSSGVQNDFHAYGLGLFGTSYRKSDRIMSHKCVRGHLGAAYNLISAHHFWENYTLSYIINGALNGYRYGTGTIYEYERLAIHSAVEKYLEEISKNKTIQVT